MTCENICKIDIYIEENRITYTINNSRTTEPILLKIGEEVA